MWSPERLDSRRRRGSGSDPGLGAHLFNGHSLNWLETHPVVIDPEMELIDMINVYRADRGLPALEDDKELTRCARGHSRHHEEHGSFQGHTNPEGDDFVERMARNGIAGTIWGENIVYAFHVTVRSTGG